MNVNWCIRGVDTQTRLRLRLLSVGRNMSLSALLKQLTDTAWENDQTVATPTIKRGMKRLIKRWRP